MEIGVTILFDLIDVLNVIYFVYRSISKLYFLFVFVYNKLCNRI